MQLSIEVTFQNGDSYEEVQKEVIIDDVELVNSISKELLTVGNNSSSEGFVNCYRKLLSKDGSLHDFLCNNFRSYAFEKLGWHDVMVLNPKFNFDNKSFYIDENSEDYADFIHLTYIQLVRDDDEDPLMYFIE